MPRREYRRPAPPHRSVAGRPTRLPLSLCDHLLAILVHQGSDPTLPYQALVIRESAMLFQGFAPWGRKAFSTRKPGPAS